MTVWHSTGRFYLNPCCCCCCCCFCCCSLLAEYKLAHVLCKISHVVFKPLKRQAKFVHVAYDILNFLSFLLFFFFSEKTNPDISCESSAW